MCPYLSRSRMAFDADPLRCSSFFSAAVGVSHDSYSSTVMAVDRRSSGIPAPIGLRIVEGKRVGVPRLSDGRPIPSPRMVGGAGLIRKPRAADLLRPFDPLDRRGAHSQLEKLSQRLCLGL